MWQSEFDVLLGLPANARPDYAEMLSVDEIADSLRERYEDYPFHSYYDVMNVLENEALKRFMEMFGHKDTDND